MGTYIVHMFTNNFLSWIVFEPKIHSLLRWTPSSYYMSLSFKKNYLTIRMIRTDYLKTYLYVTVIFTICFVLCTANVLPIYGTIKTNYHNFKHLMHKFQWGDEKATLMVIIPYLSQGNFCPGQTGRGNIIYQAFGITHLVRNYIYIVLIFTV